MRLVENKMSPDTYFKCDHRQGCWYEDSCHWAKAHLHSGDTGRDGGDHEYTEYRCPDTDVKVKCGAQIAALSLTYADLELIDKGLHALPDGHLAGHLDTLSQSLRLWVRSQGADHRGRYTLRKE